MAEMQKAKEAAAAAARVSEGSSFSGNKKSKFQNPRETGIPEAATLRDQWRFAIRQYSKWYSHAWGTAILAGVSFFALGWFIKGENPLPSYPKHSPDDSGQPAHPDAAAASSSSSSSSSH